MVLVDRDCGTAAFLDNRKFVVDEIPVIGNALFVIKRINKTAVTDLRETTVIRFGRQMIIPVLFYLNGNFRRSETDIRIDTHRSIIGHKNKMAPRITFCQRDAGADDAVVRYRDGISRRKVGLVDTVRCDIELYFSDQNTFQEVSVLSELVQEPDGAAGVVTQLSGHSFLCVQFLERRTGHDDVVRVFSTFKPIDDIRTAVKKDVRIQNE